jgi:hypothetical protein
MSDIFKKKIERGRDREREKERKKETKKALSEIVRFCGLL